VAGLFVTTWGPVILWMVATFLVSHQPKVSIPFDAPDYFAHGVAYACLGFLLTRALAWGRWQDMTWRLALAATVLGAVYGATDEFHQSFIPGRHASVADLVADAIGACLGAGAAAALGAWWRTRLSSGARP
jgi:VanZ family protein